LLAISPDLHIQACVVIDKLDKLPPETVAEELVALGVSPESVQQLLSLLKVSTSQFRVLPSPLSALDLRGVLESLARLRWTEGAVTALRSLTLLRNRELDAV
jgi:hypothetical protein